MKRKIAWDEASSFIGSPGRSKAHAGIEFLCLPDGGTGWKKILLSRKAQEFIHFSAQNDMFNEQDQKKMERALGVKRKVVERAPHLNILHGEKVIIDIRRVFLPSIEDSSPEDRGET